MLAINIPADGLFLLSASVCTLDKLHYFSVMFGKFENDKFTVEYTSEVDKGPDQYAGQVFSGADGTPLLMTWIPGWKKRKTASRSPTRRGVSQAAYWNWFRLTAVPGCRDKRPC